METQLAEPPFPSAGLDALPPADIARKAAAVGEAKVGMPALSIFVLAVLAGAFIALGAVFATTVMAGGSELPFGVTRLLGRAGVLARPDPRRGRGRRALHR